MIEFITFLLLNFNLYSDSLIKNESGYTFTIDNQTIITNDDGTVWDIVITDDDNPQN